MLHPLCSFTWGKEEAIGEVAVVVIACAALAVS